MLIAVTRWPILYVAVILGMLQTYTPIIVLIRPVSKGGLWGLATSKTEFFLPLTNS